MKKIPFLLTKDEITTTLLLFNDNKVDLTTWKKLTNDQYSHNSLLSFQNDWKVFVEYCNNDKTNLCQQISVHYPGSPVIPESCLTCDKYVERHLNI